MATPPTIHVRALDADFGRALADQLNERGFAAASAPDGDAPAQDRDGVVLDVDGRDLDTVVATVRATRAAGDAVIVAIGSELPATSRIDLLAAGADDAVPKPVVVDELALRLRTVFRRAEETTATATDQIGPLRFDAARLELSCRDEAVRVRQREFDLLRYLGRRVGQTVARGQLMADVWGQPRGNDGTVTVHVNRLRAHLDQLGCDEVSVETVHGSGYRLAVCD